MRRLGWLLLGLTLAACSSDASDKSKLTLRNTVWEHVNVQVVLTKGSNCDAHDQDFVDQQNFVLHRNQTKTIVAPDEVNICWRHDRYPNNPHPGEWTGWSHATPFPGSETTTDL
jgi:hypothetical protein